MNLELIRKGFFRNNPDFVDYIIPCESPQAAIRVARDIGGTWYWNDERGDYVAVNKGSPFWEIICKMKS